ncbi:MAG: hypothetical protein LBK06_02170 [Planctomycetaceae bacterium]|nr:hypothetical protein [Planctomycetaceae bacterium]
MDKTNYAKAVLKFAKLNTVAQQREAVVQGRSLLPYRLRYILRSYDFVASVFYVFCCVAAIDD